MKKLLCAMMLAAMASAFSETVDAELFPHRVTIQFSGCTATTPLENFPVPVRLGAGSPVGFSYADCAADSFRFTDVDGNVFPHDVECWNPDGTSVVWVSVPSLAAGSTIFLRYGAAAASLPANAASEVWSRAGYVGVWHMNEADATAAIPDAAGNNLAATPMQKAATQDGVDGLIGGARRTMAGKGEKGYFSIPNYDSLAIGSSFTISAWLKMTDGSGYSRIFSRKSAYDAANGWEIEMNNNSKTAFVGRGATNNKNVSGSFPDLSADWRLVELAYSGTTLSVYADGSLINSGTIDSTNIDNGLALSVGNNSAGNEASFYGLYDEVRLRNQPSTAAWQQMEVESARKEDFAVYSPVDQDVGVAIGATAGAGGLVRIGDGEPAESVMTGIVPIGTLNTATITAVPANGYRFRRWIANKEYIQSGSLYSPTITASTKIAVSFTAEFIPLSNCIEITNAFENPNGGFFTANYSEALQIAQPTVIWFTAPDDAPAGLREFYVNIPSADRCGWNGDWGFRTSFAMAESASTQSGVRFAGEETTVADSEGVYSYAGSWYVPAAAEYSFRMNMKGQGKLVIDNRVILGQRSNGAAVTTNGVALAEGWHSLFIVLPCDSKTSKKVGPAVADEWGLAYNAENANLAANPELGSPFATESGENAHRLSTAYNGAFIPSIWATGGEGVIIDCANACADVRVTGQLGSLNNRFVFANIPAGRSLEVGRPMNNPNNNNGYQNMNWAAWIDWSRTEIPNGVGVRFVGGLALEHPVPDGHDWSLGGGVTLSTTVADVFGVVASDADEFRYPAGLEKLVIGNPSVLGDKVTIYVPNGCYLAFGGGVFYLQDNLLPFRFKNDKYTFKNDVVLEGNARMNGTSTWDYSGEWTGNITGGEKSVFGMTGWGRRINMTGSLNIGETLSGQLGCRLNLRPAAGAAASRIGKHTLSGEANDGYTNPILFYCPQAEGYPALSIGTLHCNGAKLYPDYPNHVRSGSAISTCSNNTICVTTLEGGGVHLFAGIPGGANSKIDASDGVNGPANFVFGKIDMANTLYISSNVNIVVTNVAKAATFDYSVQSNGVNDAVLDVEGECTASALKATDVAMLPARVKGFVGEVTLTESAVKTYPALIDFDKPAPVHGGCDGSGTLVAAPAGGTFEVDFAGEPVAGDYGLARFTSGGELLAGWNVTLARSTYKQHSIKVVKDDTGIRLKVRKGGFVIVVR